jgi:hypothetical protein
MSGKPETTIASDGFGDDASPEPWVEWEYDDDPRDWDEEDGDDAECGLMEDGQCLLAGTEWCDWDCGRLG